ncbi:MAG: hypothetical protein RIF32_13820 [Leptospirales bacterium]
MAGLICFGHSGCFTNPAWSDSDSPLAGATGNSDEERSESISDESLYALLGAARSGALLADSSPPVPGNNGFFDPATNVAEYGMTLHWTAATDNLTPQAELRYRLYYSTADNIRTIADAHLNGTPVGGFVANTTSISTADLLAYATEYYFNVIVLDAAGNPAVYQSYSDTTGEGCEGECQGPR